LATGLTVLQMSTWYNELDPRRRPSPQRTGYPPSKESGPRSWLKCRRSILRLRERPLGNAAPDPPSAEALGAPFEALYDGCELFAPFVGVAMHCDIGEVISV
jgi:hypothetical protein